MRPLLCARNLSIHIANRLLCKNLNIELHAGKVYGLLGPNGCGKTTLLHTLCGLHKPNAGEIFLQNKKLKSLTNKSIAREIAILLQDIYLPFSQTVWEYCLQARFPHIPYFKRESAIDIAIVERALGIMALKDLYSRSTLELSGGEKRRLAIASVIAQTPQIYLLDEPTNHLDLHFQMQTLKYFSGLTDAAVMMTLHDVNLAKRHCDEILLMFDNGEIMQGSPVEILNEETLTRLYRCPIRKSELFMALTRP